MTDLPVEPDPAFTQTEHLWIPMPDGVRLAARMWLPKTANRAPVPALLEYIPYRKADMVRARDARNHPYFAAHGYACLRVDMRGSGDSEGHMPDMYSDHELADARHVIDWIAAQAWCNGKVGMFGTSWGGTAALQANVDAPDALKAIIAVCATHDRYEDDIHHLGGCLLTDTLEWGVTLPAILAAPPTPDAGPDWPAKWQARLDRLSYPLEAWLREEARGDYWRHGSARFAADRLSRPMLAIGGWSDRYSNSVMALLSTRPDLTWGIVGPWGHHYPDHGHPGPSIGFQALALEWWDYWLNDTPSPHVWPKLRVWERGFDAPADVTDQRNGRWAESGPPGECTRLRTLRLGSAECPGPASDANGWPVPGDLTIGAAAGDTGYFGRYGGLPLDQRTDDALSVSFTTPPLAEDMVLYGTADLAAEVLTGEAPAQITIRLCDVAPNGSSGLITRGVRNLALDDMQDVPEEPMGPGKKGVRLKLPSTAYRLREGHRLRIAVSSSYWPLIWPSRPGPEPILLAGRIDLPLFDGPAPDLRRPFPPAVDLPEKKHFQATHTPRLERTTETGPDGRRKDGWRQPYTELYFEDTATRFGYETEAEHTVDPADPLSAMSAFRHSATYKRPDGTARIDSALTATATEESYLIEADLTVMWEGDQIATRHWSLQIPRRYT